MELEGKTALITGAFGGRLQWLIALRDVGPVADKGASRLIRLAENCWLYVMGATRCT